MDGATEDRRSTQTKVPSLPGRRLIDYGPRVRHGAGFWQILRWAERAVNDGGDGRRGALGTGKTVRVQSTDVAGRQSAAC